MWYRWWLAFTVMGYYVYLSPHHVKSPPYVEDWYHQISLSPTPWPPIQLECAPLSTTRYKSSHLWGPRQSYVLGQSWPWCMVLWPSPRPLSKLQILCPRDASLPNYRFIRPFFSTLYAPRVRCRPTCWRSSWWAFRVHPTDAKASWVQTSKEDGKDTPRSINGSSISEGEQSANNKWEWNSEVDYVTSSYKINESP